MNWPWSALGLEDIVSEREVKRAYAKRLKAIDQKTDPQAFMELRAAYEAARRMARNQASFARPTPVIVEEDPAPKMAEAIAKGEEAPEPDHNTRPDHPEEPTIHPAPKPERAVEPRPDGEQTAEPAPQVEPEPAPEKTAEDNDLETAAPLVGPEPSAPPAEMAEPPAPPHSDLPPAPPYAPPPGQTHDQTRATGDADDLEDILGTTTHTWDDVDDCCAKAATLIRQNKFAENVWRPLIFNPALDLPGAIDEFEYTIVSTLDERFGQSYNARLFASAGWVRLIEQRFAWSSDGLRFIQRHPQANKLRDRFQVLINQSTDEALSQWAHKAPEIYTPDKPVPLYLRGWFVVVVYVLILFLYRTVQ